MDLTGMPWPTQRLHAAVKRKATWGYVIYRTTYSSQSDTAFFKIVDLLNSHIKEELFSEYSMRQKKELGGNEATPYHEIWAHHSPVIMNDPTQFDRASTEWVHDHFLSWVKSRQRQDEANLYPTCIVIDEESLQEFLNAPSSGGNSGSDRTSTSPIRYVKVITAFPETSDDEYDGFMVAKYPREMPDSASARLQRGAKKALSESDDDDFDGFMGG